MTTLLVTLSGPDRPGVTSSLFESLAAFDVTVLDMEQVVVRGTLVLGVLLGGPQAAAAESAVKTVGAGLGMTVETSTGADEVDPRRLGRVHVTLLGRPLLPAAVAAIAGTIAGTGANIDRIVRLSSYPVTTIELEVSGADPDRLRVELGGRCGQPARRRGGPAQRAEPPGQAPGGHGRRLDTDPGRSDRARRRGGRLP